MTASEDIARILGVRLDGPRQSAEQSLRWFASEVDISRESGSDLTAQDIADALRLVAGAVARIPKGQMDLHFKRDTAHVLGGILDGLVEGEGGVHVMLPSELAPETTTPAAVPLPLVTSEGQA